MIINKKEFEDSNNGTGFFDKLTKQHSFNKYSSKKLITVQTKFNNLKIIYLFQTIVKKHFIKKPLSSIKLN